MGGSASFAYYAAFNAMSALFALEGRTFKKHSALEGAVYKELVKTGKFDVAIGRAYTFLREIRNVGNYGGLIHVSNEKAAQALNSAKAIFEAIKKQRADFFM